jgi:hypothetical protein
MGLLVHALEVGLPRQRDERRAVEERVGHAGEEVRRPRPERAEAHARALRQAAVHVRHVGAPLLMANGDELDRGVVERLVEVQGLLARDAEHVLDPLDLQALHEKLRRLALHARNLSLRLCPANVVPPRPMMSARTSAASHSRVVVATERGAKGLERGARAQKTDPSAG